MTDARRRASAQVSNTLIATQLALYNEARKQQAKEAAQRRSAELAQHRSKLRTWLTSVEQERQRSAKLDAQTRKESVLSIRLGFDIPSVERRQEANPIAAESVHQESPKEQAARIPLRPAPELRSSELPPILPMPAPVRAAPQPMDSFLAIPQERAQPVRAMVPPLAEDLEQKRNSHAVLQGFRIAPQRTESAPALSPATLEREPTIERAVRADSALQPLMPMTDSTRGSPLSFDEGEDDEAIHFLCRR